MTSSSSSLRLGILTKALTLVSVLALSVALCVFGQEAPPQTSTQNPAQAQTAVQPQANTQAKADEGLPPQPKSPIEKATEEGTALKLSLKDVTKMALQNNLDIAISDTNEDLYQQKLVATYGPYDGTLTGALGVNRQKTINTSTLDQARSGYFNLTDGATWNFGYAQNVPTGGNLQVNYNSGRTDTNRQVSLFNPQLSASMRVQFTQPLRRNFKIDQNRTSIKLANLDLETNDTNFRTSVTNTIANVQNQYWDLVSAIRDYDIQRESVRLAEISLRDNNKKVEVGTLAPITVIQSKATLAQRQVSLIRSEETILTAENSVRQSISTDRNSEVWKKIIVPTDAPDFKEYPVNLDQAIDTALANRPELKQYQITLRQSDLNYRMLQNSKKWRFDLTGSFQTSSSAGPMAYDSKGDPAIDTQYVGGIFNAYKNLFVGGAYTWSFNFNVEVPIRSRSLESSLAQNRITQRQTLMNRMKTEQSIQVEIRNDVQRLETTKKQVETARIGREMAQAQLEGEQKRFEAGLSEAYRVLDQQSALSQAQGQELTALINYRKAIITFQKAMYTLLEANDFQIAKSSSDNIPKLK